MARVKCIKRQKKHKKFLNLLRDIMAQKANSSEPPTRL